MAGWSSLKNGSSGYVDVEIDVYDECELRLRSLFDDVLLVVLKEDCIRPLPVILGDGKNLDLFKLFIVVRECGGFDSVSRDGLWGFVAKQLGFDRVLSPSVRLVYSKYLTGIEKWGIENSRVINSRNWNYENGGCFGYLLQELGSEFEGLLKNGLDQKGNKENGVVVFECKNTGKCTNKHVKETKLSLPNSRKRCRENDDDKTQEDDHDEQTQDDDDERKFHDDDDVEGVLDSGYAKKLVNSQKRKGDFAGESLSKMLKWMIRVAKCPYAPSIGVIPHCSKWSEHKGHELWLQAIRARQALMQRRNDDPRNETSLHLGNQKMHPAMYNDGQRPTKRLKCIERLPDVTKSRSCLCCNSSSLTQTKPMCPKNGFKTSSPWMRESKTQAPKVADFPVQSTKTAQSQNEFPRRHVSLGSLFQAEVPQWTEPILDSDSKWLGNSIWPVEKGLYSNLPKNASVGSGRPDSCSCYVPGSVECVRFHIAENKMKLKQELGPFFFHWKFHCMGEEISLRWTNGEEKLFKDIIKSDPLYFWHNASKLFPRKTREDLVSYYFNVLLINQRRYQNRVTPKRIDSDDNESEFGSIGDSLGQEAVRALGSDIMICYQNYQCTDLD